MKAKNTERKKRRKGDCLFLGCDGVCQKDTFVAALHRGYAEAQKEFLTIGRVDLRVPCLYSLQLDAYYRERNIVPCHQCGTAYSPPTHHPFG